MSTPVRAPRPPRAMDYHVKNLEKVDKGSNTPILGWEEEEGEVPQRRDVSLARPLRTPCLLLGLSTSGGTDVITDGLVEAQKQQLDAVRRAAPMRAHLQSVHAPRGLYGFRIADPATEGKDAITRSLTIYVVGSPVTKEAELDERKALRARFLVPQEIPVDTYHTRLRAQRGGALVQLFLWCPPLAKQLQIMKSSMSDELAAPEAFITVLLTVDSTYQGGKHPSYRRYRAVYFTTLDIKRRCIIAQNGLRIFKSVKATCLPRSVCELDMNFDGFFSSIQYEKTVDRIYPTAVALS